MRWTAQSIVRIISILHFASESSQNMKDTEGKEIEELWCATFEMAIHQVLYVRRVYPQESFCPVTFLGVRCRTNRHPEVVEYIAQTIQLSVSAVAAGEANEVSVVLYDQETQTEYETYTFNFNENRLCSSGITKVALESDLRNMMLSIHTLEGLKIPNWSPETSFRIVVLLPSELKACTALKDAISEGKWYCPGDASSRKLKRRRPVHQMSCCGCQLYAEIGRMNSET